VIVGYGVTVPEGSLPVHSVDTVEEARMLITMACPVDLGGKYYAPELAERQTLKNLAKFGARLRKLEQLRNERKNDGQRKQRATPRHI
jgi:hypothetical protein